MLEYKFMDKKINLTELAKKAGVSLTTASRAFNNHPYVNESIRQKIFNVAAEMNYSPKVTAKRKRLGVLVSGLGQTQVNFYQSAMLFEIAKQCGQLGIGIEIFTRNDLDLVDENFLRVVLVFQDSFKSDLSKIKNAKIVGINTHIPNSPCVFSDDENGIKVVMEYFRDKGIKQPGLLLPHQATTGHVIERENYFKKYAQGNNLLYDDEFIIYAHNGLENELKKIICDKKVDALFIGGEDMALQVNCLLYKMGIKVPEDISIFSFDSSEISQYMTPPYSSISQNYEVLVSEALTLVTNILDGKENPANYQKKIPFLFNERQSIKCKI